MSNVFDIFTGRLVFSEPAFESNSPTRYNEKLVIERLASRFGDNPPRHGVIGRDNVKITKSRVYFDTYGYGNSHNSKWQWNAKPEIPWNSPMPFPCLVSNIEKLFIEYKSKEFVLGWHSDGFMWMDHRYKTTLETLRLAQKYNIKLTIETMSDLIAHDDYLQYLNNCTIVMNFGNGVSEEQERIDSPGAPSIRRRKHAVNKLLEYGIKVKYRVKRKLVDIYNTNIEDKKVI